MFRAAADDYKTSGIEKVTRIQCFQFQDFNFYEMQINK